MDLLRQDFENSRDCWQDSETRSRMALDAFFKKTKKAALAFSGGADSSFLLAWAMKCGCDVKPYFVRTQFQPKFELEDAKLVSSLLGAELTVLEHDILNNDMVRKNNADRCYHCKKEILSLISKKAGEDGYDVIMDGLNASDDISDRPGVRAAIEFGVISPLFDCRVWKNEIRSLSKQIGLPTWDKPSYACLATRIETGVPIESDVLSRVEAAEQILLTLGLSDLRLRVRGKTGLLQVKGDQLAMAENSLEEIKKRLQPYFADVKLDDKTR